MNPLIECLGWTLVHFLWQGLAVALLLAISLRLLRHGPPTRRYLAGCAALLLMVLAPVVTSRFVAKRLQPPSLPAVEPVAAAPISVTPEPRPTDAVTKIIVTAQPVAPRLHFEQRMEMALPWLVAGWCVGVLALSCRLLAGWVQIRRLRRKAVETLAEPWREKLVELARRLNIGRPLRLLQSACVEVPTVIGWLRPVILLPASCLTGLAPAQLESILAHELAHIRRHDYLVNLLQSLAETLLFYHPAVWWVSRRIREERENCCDDIAVKICGDPVAYARALATLEELRLAPAQLALAAGGGSLLQRIQRLLGKSTGGNGAPAWPFAGLVVMVMLLCLATGLRGNRAAARDVRPPAHPAEASQSPGKAVTANFSVTATGTPVLGYQWYLGPDSNPIATAGQQTVSTNQPVLAGQTATFTATAAGTQPFTYQWQSSSNSNSIATPVQQTVSNNNQTVNAGQTATFTVSATGTQPLSYQWVLGPTSLAVTGASNAPADSVEERERRFAEVRALRDAQKTVSTAAEPEVLIRTYRLDMNALFKSARQANGAAHPEDQRAAEEALREYLDKAGIDFRAMNSGDSGNSAGFILDFKTKTLVVRAQKADLDKISKILARLAPKPSVNIKASFIEIDEAVSKTAGFDWLLQNSAGSFSTNQPMTLPHFALPKSTVGSNTLYNDQITNSILAQTTGILTAPQFRALTNAMLARKGVYFLAAPQITTADGMQAELLVGETITVVFGTNAASGITYHPENVLLGTELNLVPEVSDDLSSINLEILATATEFLGYTKAKVPVPQLAKRQLMTETRVLDGQTLVLGGLGSETTQTITIKNKVPVLGDLPLLGRLFRSDSTSKKKVNLLIFVTPTLLNPDGTLYRPGRGATAGRITIPPNATVKAD